MVEAVKTWAKQNATLIYFLIAQFVAIGAAAFSMTAYMVRLETRVATLEIRGSPHLSDINNRLTVLEASTKDNKERLDKVTDIMTRRLQINP